MLATWLALALTLTSGSAAQTGGQAMLRPSSLAGWEVDRDELISGRNGRIWNVWNARADLQLYRDSDLAQPMRTPCDTSLMARFVVTDGVDDHGGGSGAALHLVEGPNTTPDQFRAEQVCGWARADDLLLHNAPAKDAASGIHRKVITLFDWRSLQQIDAADAVTDAFFERARLYDRPLRDPVHQRGSLNMADFAYVYKTADVQGERWYFVSRAASMSSTETDLDAKDWGWIPQMSVVRWDTRQAAWPDAHRSAPAHVYRSQADVLQQPRPAPVIADRAFGADGLLARPLGGSGPYPIVNEGTNTEICRRYGVECARVAFVGGLVFDDVAAEAVVTGPDDVRRERGRLEVVDAAKLDAASNINVVFVMDATRSMGPVIARTRTVPSRVAAGLADLEREGRLSPDASIRFGAVVYRDDFAGMRRIERYDLTEDLAGLSRSLGEVRATAEVADDYAEALFCGLREAGSVFASAGAEGHQNVLVVLGDQPSGTGRRCAPNDAEEAIDSLYPFAPRVTFGYAIETQSADPVGFYRDLAEVTAGIHPTGAQLVRQRFGSSEAEAERMARGVVDFVEDAGALLGLWRQRAENEIGGHGQDERLNERITEIEADFPYSMSTAIRDITMGRLQRELQLSSDEAERYWTLAALHHATIYVPGWVVLTDAADQRVNQVVLLYDYHGVYEYKNALEEFETEGDHLALLGAWLESCRGITGELDALSGPITQGHRRACDRFRHGIAGLEDHGIASMDAAAIRRLFSADLDPDEAQEVWEVTSRLFDDAATARTTLSGYLNRPDDPLWFTLGERKHIWLLAEELL